MIEGRGEREEQKGALPVGAMCLGRGGTEFGKWRGEAGTPLPRWPEGRPESGAEELVLDLAGESHEDVQVPNGFCFLSDARGKIVG